MTPRSLQIAISISPWFEKTSHEKTSHGFHGFSQMSWTFYP
jgi:hypothetical protein